MHMTRVGGCLVALAACGGSSHAPDAAPPPPIDAAPPIDAPFCPAVTTFDPATAGTFVVANDAPAAGIFDPSVLYPATANAGAMAYSAVPDQYTIRTHVAVSTDHGATWNGVAEANVSEPISLQSPDCAGGTCTGNLISEVPSIIVDPDDPNPQTQWKLFAHRYLVTGPPLGLHYSTGTITLQTAPGPNGPWTAPAKWIGWNSPAPYSSTGVQINVTSLVGSTASACLALTEPAALWYPGTIDLAVGCVYAVNGGLAIRVELLRSVDHAASFTSIGTLLSPADADCLSPGASINAPDLFFSGGTEYLVATPSAASGYTGCLTFRMTDASHVARDAQGRAIVVRAIAPSNGAFSGACTFADGAGGYALDVLHPSVTPPFQISHPAITTP